MHIPLFKEDVDLVEQEYGFPGDCVLEDFFDLHFELFRLGA